MSEADHFYRVFLLAGESLHVRMRHLTTGFNGVLALHRSFVPCSGETCDEEVACQNAYNQSGMHENISYVAPADGWYTIVADCRLTPLYSYRYYYLDVTIGCTGDCGC